MSSGGHKTSAIPRPKVPNRSRTHGTPKGKPRSSSKPKGRAPAATAGRDDSRFADFTRPIPVERQLVRGGAKRRIIAIGAAVITAAFVAALFVLPVQAWLRQKDDLDRKDEQLAAIRNANTDLANEVLVLQTPDGIEQAAREEIGYVQQGEIRYTMLPAPPAPMTLPDGWPYNTITQIVAVRSASSTSP